MRKLVILQDIPQYQPYLEDIAPDWEIIFTKDRASALPFLADAEIIVGWSRDAGEICLKKGTKLKWVQAWSAGVDSMPLEKLKEHSVLLTTSSGVHARPISESFFAMMLAQARGLDIAVRDQERKAWNRQLAPKGGLYEIHGRTLGIMGTGAIGEEIARIARAFSMRTLGLRRSKGNTPYIDTSYTQEQIKEFLSECDFVVNVLPLTTSTDSIMNVDTFKAMKPTARYYNFGRGATTDTDALILALKNNVIAGAGLDVVEPEPLAKDSPLWGMENVLITPHVSGVNPYYAGRVVDIFIDNFKAYSEGKKLPRNLVDYEAAY